MPEVGGRRGRSEVRDGMVLRCSDDAGADSVRENRARGLSWGMPHNPNRLQVVQRADALVVEIHAFATRHRRRLADLSPGLRNQVVRAAASISLNLSEACGYHAPPRVIALLEVAIGSCNEVERILGLSDRLGVHDPRLSFILGEIAGVRMMLYGLRRRLKHSPVS